MTSRVLITGGAGYIGSRLAARLAGQEGCTVTVLDNLRRGTRRALSSAGSIRFVEGDVRDPDVVDEYTRNVDSIFHLAAESAVLPAEADPDYCFDTNVAGTHHVLRAARQNGVPRVVFASSREVYGDPAELPVVETAPFCPQNAYGASKAAAEMYCRSFAGTGLEVSVVRLSNVYGPGDRGRVIPLFVERALRDAPLTLFGAKQVLDFVWIGTAIDILARIGLGPYIPGPLNLASGKGITITELAHRVVKEAQSKSPIEIMPARAPEVVRFVADISAARALLGLNSPPDPLFGIAGVIRAAQAEISVKEIYEYPGTERISR